VGFCCTSSMGIPACARSQQNSARNHAVTRLQRRLVLSFLATALLLAVTAAASASPSPRPARDDKPILPGDIHRGKALYTRYCVGCHGIYGDGRGDNAPHLDPKPRDFTNATFKCRSTPSGSLPTDDDLYRTISRGVHSTAMPPWLALTRENRADLIAYIKTFSPRFTEEKPEAPVPIPPETPSNAASIARGQELFTSMNCWSCHGKQGRGNGPSALTLTDSKGYPIVPYDFTTGTRFKCGETDEDVYRIFMTGLDGTPMPSYVTGLKPDQGWDLVHYLRTLQINRQSNEKHLSLAALFDRHKTPPPAPPTPAAEPSATPAAPQPVPSSAPAPAPAPPQPAPSPAPPPAPQPTPSPTPAPPSTAPSAPPTQNP
jgi:mono/diheme cytochrome c family protein